jgi:3-hydroxyisobutyrate dehydrogenase-like beta-hydroxyacid dehydrogenase
MRAAAEMVERRGARFLDAPFTGSKVAAENGQLVYYIGGDEAVLRQVRPILEASSKDIILIGEIGDATVMKVATNLITAATAQVAAEALAIVRRAGISAELFSRAMKSNATNSITIEMKVPMMMAGDFDAHFSVKHMLKDVRIGSTLARDFGLDLPVTEICRDMLLAELKQGRGDADYASIAQKYFPASTKVAKPIEEALTERKRPAWALPAEPKPAAPPPKPESAKTAEPEPAKAAEPEPAKAAAAAQSRGGILGWLARRY